MTTTELKTTFQKQLEEAVVAEHQLQGAIAALNAFEDNQTTEEEEKEDRIITSPVSCTSSKFDC